MNKNQKRKSILIIIIMISCLLLTSCEAFKQSIVNEIHNKYIEYTQNITVDDLEEALVVASEMAKSCNVAVKVTKGSQLFSTQYFGSAVILKRKQQENGLYHYLAVTNRHVVTTASNISVEVYLDNDIYVDAKRETYDINNDLALISFDTGILINTANINTEELKVGQFAIAVGSPYDIVNYYNTVTIGNVSAINRKHVEEDANGKKVENTFIQHTAAINSGNSGGGLYDLKGNLIGINTWKIVGDYDDNVEGLNFAIPISVVQTIFQRYLSAF